jgi:hypothetical protein
MDKTRLKDGEAGHQNLHATYFPIFSGLVSHLLLQTVKPGHHASTAIRVLNMFDKTVNHVWLLPFLSGK